ncbi:hypothetical protein [Streptomyces sp. NBC_01262]|uniref:hypothetical protein n=1 Tax=Streptomyces sp. NBC_01262 TaxID=2903803 RepID=UPI002E2F3AAA|nr:hypothetical protein [Streptomyces sp. NBC_01262]
MRAWDVGYDRLPREYRMRRSRMHAFLWVIGLSTFSLLGGMLTADDLPASFSYPFSIAWVALMGWLFYATLRSSTTVDIKTIHVRGIVRRRRLVWADVQDIRAEATYAEGDSASVVVYVYGRDGRRALLPFVDDLHVDVGRELAMLTADWQELRGADWSPDAEAAVLIRRRRARRRALGVGFTSVALAAIPLLALIVLRFSVDMPGWLKSVLHPLVILSVVPLLFALTAIGSYRRQLRNG